MRILFNPQVETWNNHLFIKTITVDLTLSKYVGHANLN